MTSTTNNHHPRIDTMWFRGKLADKRLSQRKLALLMDIDPAAMSLMIRGKRKMSVTEAAEIAKFLGVGVDEVLLRAGAGGVPNGRERREAAARIAAADNGWQDVPDVQHKAMNAATSTSATLEIPVPMSDGSLALLRLPRALTKADADRIAALVSAFAV